MRVLNVLLTEKWRRGLIIIYIILSSFAFVFSYMQFFFGVYGIETFEAGLTALEKSGEQDLSYILIVAGLTGMKIHFLGMTVCFSQIFANKRTLGYTKLMTLLNIIKLLQVILEIAIVVLHHQVSFQPLADRTDGFLRAMYKYGSDEQYRTAMDDVQHSFRCCGNQGFKDWLRISWFSREFSFSNIKKEVPFSCCNSDVQPFCLHDDVIANYREAIATEETKPLTVFKDGCLKIFYDFYSEYAIYAVFIPGCIKIALYFCLIPLLRYIETSIYWSLRTGFPQSSGNGYLISFYDEGPKPKKLCNTDKRLLSLLSLNSTEESPSTQTRKAKRRSVDATRPSRDVTKTIRFSPQSPSIMKKKSLKSTESTFHAVPSTSGSSVTTASKNLQSPEYKTASSASSSATSLSTTRDKSLSTPVFTRSAKRNSGEYFEMKHLADVSASKKPPFSKIPTNDKNDSSKTGTSYFASSSFTSVSSSLGGEQSTSKKDSHFVKSAERKNSEPKPLKRSSIMSKASTALESSSFSASSSITSASPLVKSTHPGTSDTTHSKTGTGDSSAFKSTGSSTTEKLSTFHTTEPTTTNTTASSFGTLSSVNTTSNSRANGSSSFRYVPAFSSSLIESMVSSISLSSSDDDDDDDDDKSEVKMESRKK